ncbi:MAG TPA: metal-sulfur cluster assembly factor [Ignisphaera sp.]|uniref:Metal-sulfur cluster assembly factor n=1 Tax=Ignisphaera aggregans TaxID=334771 RepID=A0A832YZB8_9CREN|nr:metal-sulfur cluster assembly factor [Ignisphaera sp.]HIP57282.1 metal-sulfur cluster assembly factor [Ignisphaera aggregans]
MTQHSEDIKARVIEILKQIYDPEIPINIYDLGLVYSITVRDRVIEVELGVTSPFCPLAFVIVKQAEKALQEAFPDMEVRVKLNLENLWDPSRMTEEGRRMFKELYGYDPLSR